QVTETVVPTNDLIFVVTGNNLRYVGDTARRVLRVQLKTDSPNPSERTGFTYPKLLEHAEKERCKLYEAALTILQAWFLAGKPRYELVSLGSFEGWSDIIREAI